MISTLRIAAIINLLLTALACGGGRSATVIQGPMPKGGTFTGVYHSPQYGEMHMVQTGDQVIGEYSKDERTGKVNGTADGNVLRFEWVETRRLVSNKPTVMKGRGYFQYMVDAANDDHVLKGEWGHGDDETGGGPWNAWKSKRSQPELSPELLGDSDSSGGESYREPESSDSDYDSDFENDELGDDIL